MKNLACLIKQEKKRQTYSGVIPGISQVKGINFDDK